MVKNAARRLFGPVYHPVARAYRAAFPPPERVLSERPAVFDDRRNRRGVLLMILAGHKAELWPRTLERAARHTSGELADICVVCSGGAPHGPAAREIAAARGWSFLQIHEDLLAHAQNMTVREFADAEFVAKMDEDMFVTEGWLEELLAVYGAAEAENRYRVGIVAPLIPINGFGARAILELFGMLDEYRAEFPEHPPVSAAMPSGTYGSPAVAEWLWRKTSPLDEFARRLRPFRGRYEICPHRFSIGAFVMKRTTFDDFGGFVVAPQEGMLGWEEGWLCFHCMNRSRVIVVAHGSLVGHFAFGTQWSRMQELLRAEGTLFD